MNLLSKVAIASLSILSTSVFAAGDQKVNCKTTTVQTPYWYGWASCHASGEFLHQHISQHHSQWITLTETKYENGNWTTYRCDTTLPNKGYNTSSRESCQYTPKANITEHLVESHYDRHSGITYYEADVIVADFNYSDRDGHVQKVEKWVNGVSTSRGHVDIRTTSTVKLRVTDNDGNVTETTRTLSPPMIQQCRRGDMLIICDDNFL
ncbi:hypothetical protein [Pseudoalteromonas umbrosa]|uniref:hypothetical protein n=1 Tax=Pseudoalteromonas umbrosa TaxID=3048489 RepID=UPI0024C34432|nr:hypothetical protein [Pseudoalteromonas sp. B95]MDK1286521.1 hypothetical protein [Pseudoalteromonas sp. B95]